MTEFYLISAFDILKNPEIFKLHLESCDGLYSVIAISS